MSVCIGPDLFMWVRALVWVCVSEGVYWSGCVYLSVYIGLGVRI